MAHTKGPWTICGLDIEHHSENQVRWVASVSAGMGDKGRPEDYANARLIAAAPDLLEALKEIPMDCPHTWPHLQACWVCKAKAAIAKAEGRG